MREQMAHADARAKRRLAIIVLVVAVLGFLLALVLL
jgi:hypothetical protein